MTEAVVQNDLLVHYVFFVANDIASGPFLLRIHIHFTLVSNMDKGCRSNQASLRYEPGGKCPATGMWNSRLLWNNIVNTFPFLFEIFK